MLRLTKMETSGFIYLIDLFPDYFQTYIRAKYYRVRNRVLKIGIETSREIKTLTHAPFLKSANNLLRLARLEQFQVSDYVIPQAECRDVSLISK